MSIQTNAANVMAAYDDGYEQGVKQGRRLERRALRRSINQRLTRLMGNGLGNAPLVYAGQVKNTIDECFTRRTKTAKRKD
ncbi:MAG TPA: hypothetical protein VE977_13875 [Pyrinomonadaceae bacterium]|nr:hypothetical protein [Pyrinomonadaceae bacterium]